MRRTITCCGVLFFIFAGMAAPASAGIEMVRIAFDPSGKDTGTNRHLNREVVVIKNTGGKKRNLDGWYLHDRGRDHTIIVGEGAVLAPGDVLRIHSGRGKDTVATGCPADGDDCRTFYDLYWDLEEYVWDNSGDRAVLHRPSDRVVDRCRYGDAAESPKRC